MNVTVTRVVNDVAELRKVRNALEALGATNIEVEIVGTWKLTTGDRDLVFADWHGLKVIRLGVKRHAVIADGRACEVTKFESPMPGNEAKLRIRATIKQ